MMALPQEMVAKDEALTGIIGSRRLVCVQTIDIARLTPHPVALVPGFVGVTGRGPKNDSNESGKTLFLAAVSLLLGDPEWRMHSTTGPQAATGLLFDPLTAGAERYPSASHGYVIGVFIASIPHERPITVWCRINDSAPYLKVRSQEGVVLARGKNSEERHRLSDELWSAFPKSSELGPQTYAQELYGPSPRALAYVSDRGNRTSGPSLLKMQAGQFKPHEIGDQLIALTGRAGAFERERHVRAELDDRVRELEARRADDVVKHEREETELEWIRRRHHARKQVAIAEESWELHFARGLLDRLEEQDKLNTRVTELEETLGDAVQEVRDAEHKLRQLARPDDLRRQLGEARDAAQALQDDRDRAAREETTARLALEQCDVLKRDLEVAADGWAGESAGVCAERIRIAEEAAEQAQRRVGAAGDRHQELRRGLEAARQGRSVPADEALANLTDAGITVHLLYDSIVVDEAVRGEWEPRLEPFRKALVVPSSQRDAAVDLVSAFPGTILVSAPHAELPEGIRAAPAGAHAFLAGLAKRSPVHPAGVEDRELGLTIVGGFETPQLGRAARIAAAGQSVARAVAAKDAAERVLIEARRGLELARSDHARAQAAQQLAELPQKLRAEEERLDVARRRLAEIEPKLDNARDHKAALQAQISNLEDLRQVAEQQLARARDVESEHRHALENVRESLGRLGLDYWRTGWTRSVEEAREALASDTRSLKRLRNLAAEAINNALHGLGTDATGESAPTAELTMAAQSRRAFVESEDEEPSGGQLKLFDAMFEPLQAYLDQHDTRDTIAEEKITALREQRERELSLAADECARLTTNLTTVQDALEHRLELALARISDEFDRLNIAADGHGAELQIVAIRPQSATDLWRWEVTPRWRRTRGGRMLPYTNRTNTAQEKLATVHLVLAALLAAPNPVGRVLILDELGDSLGENHRREAIRALAETTVKSGVTVLATCQDSVLEDAMEVADELLFFEYPRHDDAYNRPTRMFGFTEERETVELTSQAIAEGRGWW